jgi:hypothetical protein
MRRGFGGRMPGRRAEMDATVPILREVTAEAASTVEANDPAAVRALAYPIPVVAVGHEGQARCRSARAARPVLTPFDEQGGRSLLADIRDKLDGLLAGAPPDSRYAHKNARTGK